jgi:hypothetical protein
VKAEVKKINADAILISTDGLAAANRLRPLNKFGVNLPVIGTYAYGNPALIKLVGDLKTKIEWPHEKAIIYQQLPDSATAGFGSAEESPHVDGRGVREAEQCPI